MIILGSQSQVKVTDDSGTSAILFQSWQSMQHGNLKKSWQPNSHLDMTLCKSFSICNCTH